jgi:hypothetical protein
MIPSLEAPRMVTHDQVYYIDFLDHVFYMYTGADTKDTVLHAFGGRHGFKEETIPGIFDAVKKMDFFRLYTLFGMDPKNRDNFASVWLLRF